jgi:hypothetical protein
MGIFRLRKRRDNAPLAKSRTAAAVAEAPLSQEAGGVNLATAPESARPERMTESLQMAEPLQTEEPVGEPHGADAEDASDVFVCHRSAPPPPEAVAAAAEGVTLFVYGWYSVEPGPLSWVFPSVRAALDAVRTMRNAVQWCICSGRDWTDVDDAREKGAVLIEQLG